MDDDQDNEIGEPSNERTHALVALGMFRRMAAEHDVEVGVSLLVSGAWITGTLTSFRRYVDGLTTQVEKGDNTAFAEGWASAMERLVAKLLDEPFHDELAVYLRDATVWLPDGATVPRALLALRSDSVDAFLLGTSERSSSQSDDFS